LNSEKDMDNVEEGKLNCEKDMENTEER
jgi:hypothetical protein